MYIKYQCTNECMTKKIKIAKYSQDKLGSMSLIQIFRTQNHHLDTINIKYRYKANMLNYILFHKKVFT